MGAKCCSHNPENSSNPASNNLGSNNIRHNPGRLHEYNNTGNSTPPRLAPLSAYTWAADARTTMQQLCEKRAAFWDTQPTYSGRLEVWQALRLAAETTSLETAQAIVDSAGIVVPSGKLTDGCYDDLGNQYLIPVFCLSLPTNLALDSAKIAALDSATEASFNTAKEAVLDTAKEASTNTAKEASLNTAKEASLNTANRSETATSKNTLLKTLLVSVRLSTGVDLKVTVTNHTTVCQFKALLTSQSPDLLSKTLMVVQYGAKLDDGSKLIRKDTANCVVQVMVL